MRSKHSDIQFLLEQWREHAPNDRIAHLIRDVARAQMKALQSRISPFDVSFGHWSFLRILWVRDGLTQKELSDLAGVMEPTTFAAVKSMEKMGFIERKQLPGNKKNNHVFLTAKGRALEKKLVPEAENINAVSLTGVSKKSVEMLRKTLMQMIENLAQEELASNEGDDRS